MSWSKFSRGMGKVSRQMERDAQRRRRELEREKKHLEKMQELERAAFEVEEYENYIDLILTVHKESSDKWDWKSIYSTEPPATPFKSHTHENSARKNLDEYKPSFIDKTLKRIESKRKELHDAIETAIQEDEREYREALQIYKQEQNDWETTHDLAERILKGDPNAYLEAIKQTDPFSDISELGSSVEFQAENNRFIEAILHVNSEQVVPSESKSLLKSGKLSVKSLPKSRFYEIYQDYVCSCVLRVARELFALLPVDMVIVNALGMQLNTQTGHMEELPILSVAIPRQTLEGFNIDMIDPSDSMNNFVHRMVFKKTQGFRAVDALSASDLGLVDD